jgi:N,N'-diacetyllegionaminate synthase
MEPLNDIIIGHHTVGINKPPLIIAEIGVNHNGNISLAYELVDAAKETGADIVKFQTFKAEKLAFANTPKVEYQKRSEPGKNESHYEMLKRLELSFEETSNIKAYCDKIGISFMSTPYDAQCVNFLNEIDVPAFKVASADLVDYRIHQAIAKTNKPVIQSVGMCEVEEIKKWKQLYEENYPIILLQCTANYPSDPKNSNLKVIESLREEFAVHTGFSDHTPNEYSAFLSVAMKSVVVERHFTLDCNMDGPDHKASTEPEAFKKYCDSIKLAYEILGDEEKSVISEERGMRSVSRKGVYLANDVKDGQPLSENDLIFRRPSTAISPLDVVNYIGKKVNKTISKDLELKIEDLLIE